MTINITFQNIHKTAKSLTAKINETNLNNIKNRLIDKNPSMNQR